VELVRETKRLDEAIAMITPQGYRIEGLTLEQVTALLQVLA
jgi:hypothetical protein